MISFFSKSSFIWLILCNIKYEVSQGGYDMTRVDTRRKSKTTFPFIDLETLTFKRVFFFLCDSQMSYMNSNFDVHLK